MRRARMAWLWVTAAVAAGCAKTLERTVTRPEDVATLDRRAPYLKAHTAAGAVYVLSPWEHHPGDPAVTGTGVLLGVNRDTLMLGTFAVPLDSVVLFETNVTRASSSVTALSIMTGISLGVTAYCLANPKACFGSCPTFYTSDGSRDLLQAEGFSASIAPSLEATDVDHLFRARPAGDHVDIRMVNEALETHVVRFVNLLAVPRPRGTRIFAGTDGRFWRATDLAAPDSCRSVDGDCLPFVAEFDGREWTSAADSVDLAAREELELAFPATGPRPGLVLATRQSLLQTYLLYQAFAWMGTSAGQWLAQLERGGAAARGRLGGVTRAIGGIEVLVRRDEDWVTVETIVETGPLASDTKVIPLPAGADRVRLRAARGAWRYDYVALVALDDTVEPIRTAPQTVRRAGHEDPAALALLRDPTAQLVTLPGDDLTLRFALPGPAAEVELFLESRGYYLEWMRDEWVAEEDPARLAQLLLNPRAALRSLAPEFSRTEPELERTFWSSKYVRP